jgi:hypothetical protein
MFRIEFHWTNLRWLQQFIQQTVFSKKGHILNYRPVTEYHLLWTRKLEIAWVHARECYGITLSPLWFLEEVIGPNPSPGTICINWENRPTGFLTLVWLSSESEISQNPNLWQMSQYISCHFHSRSGLLYHFLTIVQTHWKILMAIVLNEPWSLYGPIIGYKDSTFLAFTLKQCNSHKKIAVLMVGSCNEKITFLTLFPKHFVTIVLWNWKREAHHVLKEMC